MATRDDVYTKFGETAEAAQLLETELGTVLLLIEGTQEGLFFNKTPELAKQILDRINKKTLGQLLRKFHNEIDSEEKAIELLESALDARNRLVHGFFLKHGWRINTNEGRDLMIQDLTELHEVIFSAYKFIMKMTGTDLDALSKL